MLEVALVFTFAEGEKDGSFQQTLWKKEVEPWYDVDVIAKALDASSVTHDGGWLPGCLRRIRAFGIYEQSDANEYALALAVAMLRLCKFESRTAAERGRRIFGLMTAVKIIRDIHSGNLA